MKKIIASLALSAALGTGFAAGAQAQTVAGARRHLSLTVTPNGRHGASTHPTDYLYTYEVTLTQRPSNTAITQFSINNIKGYISGTAVVTDGVSPTTLAIRPTSAPTRSSSRPAASGVTGISFSAASTGLVTAGEFPLCATFVGPGEGDTALFGFGSTYLAPPK